MKEKWYRKLSEYLWQIVVAAVGIICVIISFSISTAENRIFSLLNGLGVSLLSSGILGVFMNLLFYRRDRKSEFCEEWKIEQIYNSRALSNIMADRYQKTAKRQIDIIAFGLGSWRQANEKIIDEAIERKVKIRIITMHPDNPYLKIRDSAEGKPEGSTRTSIMQLHEFFQKSSKRRKVEIKYHMGLPLDFYFRIDDHIFVGPYLFGKESQQMITYEFGKDGEGFDYYKDYFDNLWNQRTIPSIEFREFSGE